MSSRLSNDFPMPQRDNRAGRAILMSQAFNTRFCWRPGFNYTSVGQDNFSKSIDGEDLTYGKGPQGSLRRWVSI